MKQDIGAFQVGALPGREVKTGGVAQRIHGGMDLGAQSAAAASDSPSFAPALC